MLHGIARTLLTSIPNVIYKINNKHETYLKVILDSY